MFYTHDMIRVSKSREDPPMNQNAAPLISAVAAAIAALVISLATGSSATQAIITTVIVAVVAYAVTMFQARRGGRT